LDRSFDQGEKLDVGYSVERWVSYGGYEVEDLKELSA